MSQYKEKKIQSNGESLDIENARNAIAHDTLADPMLSKKSKGAMLTDIDQTLVFGQPENNGNNPDEPSMKRNNVDIVLPKKDANLEKQSHSNVNSVFQGLRSVYEQFEEKICVGKQGEETAVKERAKKK